MLRRTRILISLMVLCPLVVSAREESPRPYHFAGPCTSQGSWTQAAMANSHRLREITKQLRDDGNCKGLSESLVSTFNQMDAEFIAANGKDGGSLANSLATVPQEISALRSFAQNDNGFRYDVMNLLMKKTFEHSGNIAAASKAALAAGGPEGVAAAGLLEAGQRVARGAQTSLQLFNGVISSLPKIDECVMQKQEMGQFFALSTKLLASIASSGRDVMGNEMATAVSRLATYFRDAKFAEIMAKLNEQDLMVSTSCLLEVTSESYCSARDGQMLFNDYMKNYKVKSDEKGRLVMRAKLSDPKALEDPMNGYYVLMNQVPQISAWLQQILIGVTPQRNTDASSQEHVLNEVNMFFILVKSLEGEFNEHVTTIKALPDLQAQQNAVLQLLTALSGRLENSRFFMMRMKDYEILFRLLDYPVPPEVLPQKGQPTTPIGWLQREMKHLPMFNEPDKLLAQIGHNLQDLIQDANKNATAYFNQWYVVDQPGLVLRSLVGANYNVRDSFEIVDRYLAVLDEKIQHYSKDLSMIPMIRETRTRIHRILTRYDEVKTLSQKYAGKYEDLTPEQMGQVNDMNIKLISAVYDEMRVMLARSTFLANRMNDFVAQDFNLTARAGINVEPFFPELYAATGQQMVDRMLQMAGSNPAMVKEDLQLAMRLNKSNIEVLEALLKDKFTSDIAFLKMVSENQQPDAWSTWAESHARAYNEKVSNAPGENISRFRRVVRGVMNYVFMTFGGRADRYKSPGWRELIGLTDNVTSVDDEFHNSKNLVAQFCVQGLAFTDVTSLWPVCKKAELKSPFPAPGSTSPEGARFDDYLSVNFAKKAWENIADRSLNHSQRICAFRDYNRRNLVAYLTQAQKDEAAK